MTPIAMFAVCLGGMALGLAVDTADVHPEALASLCTGSDAFLARMRLHWRFMPATHGLMLAAAVVAMSANGWRGVRRSAGRRPHCERLDGGLKPALRRFVLRGCADGLRIFAMVLGMAAGTHLAPELATTLGVSSFAALVTAMVLGMGGAMALLAAPSWHARMRGRFRHSAYRADAP